jgi:hypothetical protein
VEKDGKPPVAFAIADLVDNSLAATRDNVAAGRARNITVSFVRGRSAEDSLIAVCDNGQAMSNAALRNWCAHAPLARARRRIGASRAGLVWREGPVRQGYWLSAAPCADAGGPGCAQGRDEPDCGGPRAHGWPLGRRV